MNRLLVKHIVFLTLMFCATTSGKADWPTLRGSMERGGYVTNIIGRSYELAWATSFDQERISTGCEPIIAAGRTFIATHSGNIHALNAETGKHLWSFTAGGAFMHSPAVFDDYVAAGNIDGYFYLVSARDGRLLHKIPVGHGGISVSPAIDQGVAYIGTRGGDFLAIDLKRGTIVWKISVDAPIRQTAAITGNRVIFTAEDLRSRAVNTLTGELLWTSEQMNGQAARDYYPIVVKRDGRSYVIVRTNPVLSMGHHIARDRSFLTASANIDASDWKKLDAWTQNPKAIGTPELWAMEQKSIVHYLKTNRLAQTFYMLDLETGREPFTAPILWVGGCQGVGAMPALATDNKLLVFYRSAYGNWNHGVAPLVALGLLDLAENKITPLKHQSGMRPPWNTFWGTADEAQNFTVAGEVVLIAHQGTLSGYDWKAGELFGIWGERDTYGGFRNPPWARNEWHGPARGSAAVVKDRIYWITGSRLLCLEPGNSKAAHNEVVHQTPSSKVAEPVSEDLVPSKLSEELDEILGAKWAPLFLETGLGGRDFSFDDSGEIFEALAWVFPTANPDQQIEIKQMLAKEWKEHPPYGVQSAISLQEGRRREYFLPPIEVLTRISQDKRPHPFGNLHAVWLYAERCGEWPRILASWPEIKRSFEDFAKLHWKLGSSKGDLYANRYLNALMAYQKIAAHANDVNHQEQVQAMILETTNALIKWWELAATQGTLNSFKGSSELDPFIGKGDLISHAIMPHRHKLALFQDFSPEIAAILANRAPEATVKVWNIFERLYRTWPLSGEERQIHSGENFIDAPDLALSAFKVFAWLGKPSRQELLNTIDIPFCKADLAFITKASIALENKH